MSLCIQMQMPALTCTGPCRACCLAAEQGSHAVSPWHARPAAPGSCCCPRNSGDCRYYIPPGRHGPSSGSARSSWGCPAVKERNLTLRQKNLRGKAFTWAALPTSRVFVYCSPEDLFSKECFSIDLAWCEKRHCLMNSLPPPSQRLGDLGPLGTKSKILAWPSKDLLSSLGTAAFRPGAYCPFGL